MYSNSSNALATLQHVVPRGLSLDPALAALAAVISHFQLHTLYPTTGDISVRTTDLAATPIYSLQFVSRDSLDADVLALQTKPIAVKLLNDHSETLENGDKC